MRGLAKGEQATSTNPVLQLLCRSGQFLTDIYAGTFKIQDISDPAAAPSDKVAETPFNLDLVAAGGHKLGTGRYYIPTGSTATWNYGTHRAICQYTLVAGGKTYTQVTEFEVLNEMDFITGAEYVGYVSTRELKRDGVTGTLSPTDVHNYILTASRHLEGQLGRIFDPTYMVVILDGTKLPVLYLDEAVIAVEKIETVWKDMSGGRSTHEWMTGIYQVYNRHLDRMLAPDDRLNPRIELINSDGDEISWNNWQWPYGQCNIEISGVFGYTDPDYDPAAGRVNLGRTPRDLASVIKALVSRQLEDASYADTSVHQPGRIRSEKTRDQSITYMAGGASSGSTYDSFTGDPLLDKLLVRMARPINMGYAQRRYLGGYTAEV